MRVTLTALIFVIALQAAAQNIPATAGFDTQTVIARPSQPAFSFASPKPTKPRVFDRKFLLLAGIATAATVLDVATTSHCMSTMRIARKGTRFWARILHGQALRG